MNSFAQFYKKKSFHAVICLCIVLFSALLFLPFACSNQHWGHDLKYHFNVIRSLFVAWERGGFNGKVMELIGGDYGYGTGIFYSTMPASVCVALMKILHLPIIAALYIEFVLLFSAAGIVIYFFLFRIFHNSRIAAAGCAFYLLFPYYPFEIYTRFAIAESFLLLAIPMIVWGVFELLYKNNYRAFLPLFIGGYALAIFSHLTMTVYATLFLAIWLLMEHKKTFTRKNVAFFALATAIVLLITACYYLPMAASYGVTETADMSVAPKLMIRRGVNVFISIYHWFSILTTGIMLALYAVYYARKRKQNRTRGMTVILTLSGLAWFMLTPIFPWYLMPSFLRMIQYPFRIFLFGGLLATLQFSTLLKAYGFINREELCKDVQPQQGVKKAKISAKKFFTGKNALWRIGVCICALTFLVNGSMNIMKLRLKRRDTVLNNVSMAEFSGFSDWFGLGAWKNGDYFPKNCTYEYASTRLSKEYVSETDVKIDEFSDYSGLSQISFLANVSGYAVLDIPYDLFENAEVYRYETVYTNKPLKIALESVDGGVKTRLTIPDYEAESKIILSYKNAPELKEYLQSQAFGVLTMEGDVVATNLKKERVGKYSVEVNVVQNGGVLELPSYYYKGYTLTLEKADGSCENIEDIHGRNGFLEAKITESGTLYVEYTGEEFRFAYMLTAIGLVGAIGLCVVTWLVQKKKQIK
ncbi:MAG: hypothetical protein IJV83_02405 [Clostridia bacterium]|nr:hypothetical protein [Clostridia bacterium]